MQSKLRLTNRTFKEMLIKIDYQCKVLKQYKDKLNPTNKPHNLKFRKSIDYQLNLNLKSYQSQCFNNHIYNHNFNHNPNHSRSYYNKGHSHKDLSNQLDLSNKFALKPNKLKFQEKFMLRLQGRISSKIHMYFHRDSLETILLLLIINQFKAEMS